MKTSVPVFCRALCVMIVWATGACTCPYPVNNLSSNQIHIKLEPAVFPDLDITTGLCNDLHQLAELVDYYSDEAVKSATTTTATT
jgi:hypothetical protein